MFITKIKEFPLQRGFEPKHARTFAKHNLIPHLRAFSLFESPQKSSALDAELRLAPLFARNRFAHAGELAAACARCRAFKETE
ncbi:MAG: hypothetical protein GWP19_13635 [Planctomycetia bacterium]|nr:hypothetical protein [Planctomycetia bacterium]